MPHKLYLLIWSQYPTFLIFISYLKTAGKIQCCQTKTSKTVWWPGFPHLQCDKYKTAKIKESYLILSENIHVNFNWKCYF